MSLRSDLHAAIEHLPFDVNNVINEVNKQADAVQAFIVNLEAAVPADLAEVKQLIEDGKNALADYVAPVASAPADQAAIAAAPVEAVAPTADAPAAAEPVNEAPAVEVVEAAAPDSASSPQG